MKITFVLYDEMTALDLVGPYQVLSALPGAEVSLAAVTAGPKRTDSGMQIVADRSLAEISECDIIVVPGTGRPQVPLSDERLIGWLARAQEKAKWICSVCTGSILLGAAGLLRGRKATTHWMAHGALAEFGATPVQERVVFDGPFVTSAGVSAGIDMALTLVTRIAGPAAAQTIQLAIEYDPDPPHRCGSLRSAPAEIVEAATRALSGN